MRQFLAAVAVGVACISTPAASPDVQETTDRDVILAVLNRYERTASTGALVFKNVKAFTTALDAVVPDWIQAAPEAERTRRRHVAALVVLDLTIADYRGGGQSLVRIGMIEWGCAFLRQQAPSEFERRWMLASYAVLQPIGAGFGGGSRDVDAHLNHALSRFPNESRFRLAQLLTRPVAWGLSNRPGARESLLIRSPRARILSGSLGAWPLSPTLRALEALSTDPIVGPEARAHVGLIHFHQKNLRQSLTDLTGAANTTTDPFVRNLAWLIAGFAYDAQRRSVESTRAYERAVAAIPKAKASATALAAQWFLAGRREEASALLDEAYGAPRAMLDPWQRIAALLHEDSARVGQLGPNFADTARGATLQG